ISPSPVALLPCGEGTAGGESALLPPIPAFPRRWGKEKTSHAMPLLDITALTKRFGGFTALSGVSFQVQEGAILGLIGPNGSGKTPLFNRIAGALRPTSGSIHFRGREITGLTPDAICHRGIARTFQIPRPFRKLSILENVAVAAYFGSQHRHTEEQARQRAREILALVGLPTDATATTAFLGAGGLKKLELAKALATEPQLLLADESLGGLEPPGLWS